MKGLLPLTQDAEQGQLLKHHPPALQRFMPGWLLSDAEILDYSFGIISTQSIFDDQHTHYTFRLTNLLKKTSFTIAPAAGALYLYLCIRGASVFSVAQETVTLEEMTGRILYLPPGETIVSLQKGISIFLFIEISNWLPAHAHHPPVGELLTQLRAHPAAFFQLPAVALNYWLLGSVNLLLNIGRHERYSPPLTMSLDRLLKLYLNESDATIDDIIRQQLQLHILTGRPVGKTSLPASSAKGEQFQDIVQYLLGHLKKNYYKKTIAEKSDLAEKQFSRLFKDVYGKSFQEGYLELRMMQALQWVVEEEKLVAIAENAGYSSASNFTAEFKKFYGYPPSLYQWPYLNGKFDNEPS
jgi:AraC-like DNA-binding protein